MASFQAKIGWKMPRKSGKKMVPMSSYSIQNREFQRKGKKFQKIKQHHYGYFSSQNKLGQAEKEKK